MFWFFSKNGINKKFEIVIQFPAQGDIMGTAVKAVKKELHRKHPVVLRKEGKSCFENLEKIDKEHYL